MNISKIQYITSKYTGTELAAHVEFLCQNGLNWVQYRNKTASDFEFEQEAKLVQQVCLAFNCTFIINDRIDIAKKLNADGVHVGLEDMSIQDAIEVIGNNKIIGGTANRFEDVVYHQKQGASYVGLGPYKNTSTKDKLSPILGANGIQEIVTYLNKENINIPIIAIGGIELENLEEIKETGSYGIAVSGALNEQKKAYDFLANKLFYYERFTIRK